MTRARPRGRGARATKPRPVTLERLRAALARCVRAHDPARALALDPVRFARRHADPRDREAAAFLASALAFGNVKAIGTSCEALFAALGPRPARAAIEVARGARRLPSGLYHRWFGPAEIEALVAALGRALAGWGSLEACFLAGLGTDDAHVGPALEAFAKHLLSGSRPAAEARGEGARVPRDGRERHDEPAREQPGRRVPLLPSPAQGSACKRPCLFLRWVARPDDGIDLGLWRSVSPARLVVPVDVHVARVARRLGLTRRKTIGWQAALEITEGLRRVDPLDPLRFDFAMVHADREAVA